MGMSDASSKVARASRKRKTPDRGPGLPTSPYIGVDRSFKRQASYARMAKKKGGGASRRGSHRMADAGGCEVRWYYSHHLKLHPVKGNYYMDFGTLVHTGLSYHHGDRMERKPEWLLEKPDVVAAMELDSEGHPDWLRSANDLMAAYKRFYDADPWNPIFNEEEFEASIGDIDPDGDDEPAQNIEYEGACTGVDDYTGEPCKNLDDHGVHIAHQTKRVLKLPRLNDELVTCRPDLVVESNGDNWIIDHKTAPAARDGSQRLKVIDPRWPDYQYYWQAMVNLHIVRKGRSAVVDGIERLPIKGFIFNRLKRDMPFDFSRDLFDIPARQYAKVPRSIRATIQMERGLAIKSATNPGALIAYPWECQSKYQCSFVRPCHANDVNERNNILRSEFFVEG